MSGLKSGLISETRTTATAGPSTPLLAKGASSFAQDDRVSGGVGEKRQGAEGVEKLGIANLRAMRRAQDGAPGLLGLGRI